jgi:hypothetical protein
MPMSLNRSMAWGFVLALGATVITLVVGFIAGAGFSIPGVVEMSSSTAGGGQSTSFSFNPLAPLLLAVLLGLLIWSVSRARDTRGLGRTQDIQER